MKCSECGAQSWIVVEKLGSLEKWECNQCGSRSAVHVNDAGIGDSFPQDLSSIPELHGIWLSKPSAETVQRAEVLFPRLERLSLAQHLRRYVDKTSFSLGRVNAVDRLNLGHKLGEAGMGIFGE